MNDRIARVVTPSRRDFRMNAGNTPLSGFWDRLVAPESGRRIGATVDG